MVTIGKVVANLKSVTMGRAEPMDENLASVLVSGNISWATAKQFMQNTN